MKSLGLTFKKEKNEKKHNLKIAASTVGALKYFSECNVLDMLGLTNEFIAHNPKEINEISNYMTGWKERNYNADYVLVQRPDYIIFSTQEKPSSFAERALFTKYSFYTNYLVTPIFLICSETPLNVYKKCSAEQLKVRERIVQNNPNYNNTFVNLYNLFLNQFNSNSIEQNLVLCDSVIRLAPSYFGEPYRFLAVEYFRKYDYSNAFKCANKCLERDSLNFYARLVLYQIGSLVNKGEITKAQGVFFEKYFPQLYLKNYFFEKI
jgi:tetratricopeptide (TPR) repeat protein